MSEQQRNEILAALGSVSFPGFQRDIVSMGMVQDLSIEGGRVTFRLATGSAEQDKVEQLVAECRRALSEVDGVEELAVQVQRPLGGGGQGGAAPAGGPQAGGSQPGPGGATAPSPQSLPGVDSIIAVASGKGGVGKSTVAVNLAAALKSRGQKVGLMDADVYGPSIPTMMGLEGKAEVEGNRVRPMERHGLRTVSMGFFVEPEQAVIWRGPMVMKAIRQFFMDVDWGELDTLVVDLPPGTGDTQLTLVQLVSLAGAVIVTTPQEVALADARKAVAMFRKTGCPILGIVENMSCFVCPSCGEEHDIFSRGGGKAEAEKLDVPFLGEVPLTPRLRESSDAGVPLVVQDPEDPASQAFLKVADQVLETLAEKAAQEKGSSGIWPFRRS